MLVNKGRMGKADLTQVQQFPLVTWLPLVGAQPFGNTRPLQAFVSAISSSGVVLASWVGRNGPIEVRRTIYFGESDVTIYMHTAIVNTGTSKVRRGFC